jgi:hypothetical protein
MAANDTTVPTGTAKLDEITKLLKKLKDDLTEFNLLPFGKLLALK